MERRRTTVALAVAILLGALVPWQGARAAPVDAPVRVTSTDGDRTSAEITVYNVGLGLVKDRRNVTLPPGESTLLFMDVASQVIPSSVSVRSVKEGDAVSVLEQNYEYDLLSATKLLEKYVGRTVRIRYRSPYTDREDEKEAKVLAYNDGQPVLSIDNEVTFGVPGNFIFPEVPRDLIARPTLSWLLGAKSPGKRELEALYLTNGMTWRADYVLVLGADEDRADLSGWVTLDNRSGATFRSARLKLVAGDVHRVREDLARRGYPAAKAAVAMEAAPEFRESELFEYHLYALSRPTDVKNNQSKQVGLLAAEAVPVKKEYVFYGADHYYRALQTGEIVRNQKVPVFLLFRNDNASRLGMPLPKGIVRVYKRDKEDALQFVGENAIDHTPKDEKVRLMLGDAFDVVGDRKQTDWKVVSSNTYEAAYEISLRNHKKDAVTVRVVEPIPGEWKILDATHSHEKEDSRTAVFPVKVDPDKEVKLRYRVRMRF
ncbi:MAG TPA: hypothetical protein VFT11_03500 [Candidatus Deferrimicrobiaceae bacterium]|nr:hypothetical protein [Candidatus Deferrimicrobiaceae bacterium]